MRKGNAGFSLVEILLSAAILAIGLGIAMFSLVKGLQGTDVQYVSAEASQFAHARLERIRAGLHPVNDSETITFSQIDNAPNDPLGEGYNGTYFQLNDSHGNQYLGQTQVSALGTTPEMLIIDAVVCVRLKDGKIIGNATNWSAPPANLDSPFHLQTAIVGMD